MAFCLSARAQVARASSIPGRTIVIDAGHGGFDPGASGALKRGEDTVNLAIAKSLKAELLARGYNVVMTREDDNALGLTKSADMRKRLEIIELCGPDYVVSIHLNANRDRSCCGPVVLYHPHSDVGMAMALKLQQTLNLALSIAKPRTVQKGDYIVLGDGSIPGVIVECGFITNAADEALLFSPDYQAKVAAAIATGLDEFVTNRIDAANALRKN
jgi:N-acetylmuramoyl-L-alanine amidase